MRAPSRGVLVALVALSFIAAPTAAHGDGPGHGDGSLTLAPGGHEAFPVEVHWHRVVGTLRAVDPPEARAEVLVLDEPAYAAFQAGDPFAPTFQAGPASAVRLNALIRCCDDATWTPYRIVVRNADPDEGVTFDVQLQTIHDDAGVSLTAAESGGVPVYVGLVFGGAALVLGRRVWPEIGSAGHVGAATGRLGDPAVRAALVAGAVLVGLVGLSVAGMAAFGGSPIEGAVAALALFPFPESQIISRTIPLFGGALVGTLYVLHLWTRTIQRDGQGTSPRVLLLGALAAGAMATVLVLGTATYGPQALVGGLAMTGPLVGVVAFGIHAVRRARRGT